MGNRCAACPVYRTRHMGSDGAAYGMAVSRVFCSVWSENAWFYCTGLSRQRRGPRTMST